MCHTCLEEHEEKSKESVHDIVLRGAREFGIPHRHLCQIGTFSRPQGGSTEPNDDRSRNHQGPHGIEIGGHIHNIATHGKSDCPLAAQLRYGDRWRKHTTDDEGGVQYG